MRRHGHRYEIVAQTTSDANQRLLLATHLESVAKHVGLDQPVDVVLQVSVDNVDDVLDEVHGLF